MMHPSELRLTNYVYDVFDKSAVNNITTLGFEGFQAINNYIRCNQPISLMYKPIPLTEEWLTKLGFKSLEYREFWGHGYFYKGIIIYIENNEFRFYYQTNRAYTIYEYVHELQNLYQSLTGKELVYEHSKS